MRWSRWCRWSGESGRLRRLLIGILDEVRAMALSLRDRYNRSLKGTRTSDQMRLAVILLIGALLPSTVCSESPSNSAFETLKTLVGEWKREGDDGAAFRIVFSTTANDTVLVEDWRRNGKSHSLTLYHVDGDAVLATHYCPQGNQPRLTLVPGNDDSTISFDFMDVTNLENPQSSHQHRLTFDIVDSDTVIRKESYRQGDVEEPSQMRLVRLEEETVE